ncbi:hypothetical protein LSCM1_01435 [Leishmania martiniquensis]|uniref:CSD domain-containing protein n=1 Tax=Leishmania martiniquensis TaxID=1580590 RepID=A0A836KEU4_9TRYP|nr:hypothetical protein LSCM1_01435 [Leishmania martiniquensis]
MSLPEHNTRGSDRGGHKRFFSDSHQVAIQSAAHLNSNDDGGFHGLSRPPWGTQIPYVPFSDLSSRGTPIGADCWSDFSHVPGAAPSLASFTTNASQLQQPLQIPAASAFQNLDMARTAAVATSLPHPADDRKDRQKRNAKLDCSQQHGQTSGGMLWPLPAKVNCLPGGGGSCSTAQAPPSSSVTTSKFVFGLNCSSGAYADFTGGLSGATMCGDSGLATAAEAGPINGGVGAASSQQQLVHQCSDRPGSGASGNITCSATAVNENEFVMVRPHFLQILLQQYQQQHSAPPLHDFMYSAPPRSAEPGGLTDSPAVGSAVATDAMNANLMQFFSGSGGNAAGQMIPTPPNQRQLISPVALPPHWPSTEPFSQAPQASSTISWDTASTLQPIRKPDAYIRYPEAQKRGTIAAAAVARHGGGGKVSSNTAAAHAGSLEKSKLNLYHLAPPPPPTATMKESTSGTHVTSPVSAASLASMAAPLHPFGMYYHCGAAAMPQPSPGMHPPFAGPPQQGQTSLPSPPRTVAAQAQPTVKPSACAGNAQGSRRSATTPAAGNNSTSATVNGHNGGRHQQGGDSDHARSQSGAATHTLASSAHAEPKNGANFEVGAWYEGIVKRYNPLRGFGFLTCTHRLSLDFHACESACTRRADAEHGMQQTLEGERAAVAATPGERTPLQGVEEADFEHGKQQRPQKSSVDEGASRPDDRSTAPFSAVSEPAKEDDIGIPQSLVAAGAFSEGGNGAAAPAARTGMKDAENADVTAPAMTDMTSTGKAHGTVVYSTMQWYLHMAAAKETSAEDAVASPAAHEGTSDGGHSRRPPFADFGRLEREPAQLGDIFVHHSCISMDGFRVFVPGTVVRFSVAVLMNTVQAVDVVPLGPEWKKPLSLEALVRPPLYKVTPTAATVLRYHHLAAQRAGDAAGESSGGPQSLVGSGPVEWTDMAVIPSPAIPNSIEGRSELFVVHVPRRMGPLSSMAIVTPRKAGPATGPKASSSGAQAATCTGPTEALLNDPLPIEVVHLESITAPFGAMTDEDQRALQGEPGAPAIAPTAFVVAKGHSDASEPRVQLTAEARRSIGSSASPVKVSDSNLSESPIALCSGGMTSSKGDQANGCGSYNPTMTSTPMTNPVLSSDRNTSDHSQALRSSRRDMHSDRGDMRGAALTGTSGGRRDPVLRYGADGQPIAFSYGCGACQRTEKDHRERSTEADAGGTAAAVDEPNEAVAARTDITADKCHPICVCRGCERRAAGSEAAEAQPSGDSPGSHRH